MIIENWALKKVAEEISNLAFDYISSCLQENAHNVFTKIRLYHMKKRIKKWCDDFLIKHDGTVLTEGRFIRFLSTYRVFEEILTYSNANISDLSEDEFIKGLLKKTKTGISGKLSPTDEMLIKEFYEKLLKRFNECWLSLLSNSEQQLLHRMSVQNASLRDTINSLNYKNQSILEKNGSQISEKDTISLFEELNKRYWDGEFDFLHNIALCKQNEYVLVGVEMLLTFIEHISEPQCSVSNIIEFLNQIVNDDSVLITYMTKMVQYRVINLINQSTLLRVIKSTDKKVDRLWINFLKEINRTQGPYRKLMLTELSFVGKKIMEISEPPIGGRMQMLIYLLIKLRPIKLEKVEYRINDGEIEIEMYYEPYKESVENNK